MGGEAGHIEEAHRQEDEPDRDRKDAHGEAKAVQRQRESRRGCVLLRRFARRGRFSAAVASNCEVEHDFLKSIQDLSSSSI